MRSLKHVFQVSLVVSAVFAASSAHAGLKPFQAKAKAESEKSLSSDIAALNKTCGTKIEVSLDMSAYTGDDWTHFIGEKPGQICGHALGGVEQLCKDAAYKSAVAEHLKKITCSCDGSAEPIEKNLSFSGGAYSFKMNPKHDNMNPSISAKQFLAKELNK